MLSHCLELSRAGQPVWLPDMRAQCKTLPDAVPVTMQLTLCDGRRRDFSLPIPRWRDEAQRRFVLQYVIACVYNTLSVLSGREMAFYLDLRETEIAALLASLNNVFQVRDPVRSGCGKVITIANRLRRVFDGEPFSFAIRSAARVSAVSPDWLMTITSVFSSSGGLR